MRCIVVSLCGVVWAVCHASAAIIINEIHYNPDVKTDPGEFVELYNSGTNTVNLAGWAFTDGINYTLPSVNIAPGGYVVVAQNPAFLQTRYGTAGALGPFNPDGSSGLSSRGEKLTLRNAAGQVADEVDYQMGFPWPTVGDSTTPGNGNSIELIHPSLDNNLAGSWRASGSGAGGTPIVNTTLLPAAQTWKYFKGTSEASAPTTAWRQPAFDDSAWSSGALPIGYGETFIASSLPDMNGLYTSVFLRKQFNVADPSQFNRLVLESQYDDGFKMWINGTLVVDNTANMAAGEVPFNGTSATTFEQGTFANINMAGNPLAALVSGVNTVAVQAHNTLLSGSSDFFFDMRLIGQTGGSGGNGPSPGRVNTVFANNAPPQIRQVEHTPEQPKGGEVVKISARVTDPDGVGNVMVQYQIVEPGNYIDLVDSAYTNAANWISLTMNDNGTGGDSVAGDAVFTVEVPASVQAHRRLIRYRITVADIGARSVRVPYADDPQPNFAYFVYDGVPAWSGAVQPGGAGSNGLVRTIPAAEMGRLPTFHLIAKSNNVATATWFERYAGDLYKWGGTLVYDGKVYDHIRYRARGGVWRYSMVKNMWKIDLNRGHDIEIRDNWGRKFKTPWTKINLGANIQQRDFWHRGEQGMYESVGMRVFQLANVAAPHTAFVTLRVIDDAQEQAPNTQYEGDFWGMYLAIEQENGRFLEEHDLPDSNLYKMEGGTGELNNLGPNGPADKSDLNYILNNYTGKAESWWRTNWNLPRYYSYQAVAQAIHHYDICYDKNFFYYINPSNRLWEVVTWDLDLTWANNMYDAGCGGKDRVYQRIFDEASPAKPNIRIEWNNRIREFRDLFWNSDEAHKLIDEYAALARGPSITSNILDADRMVWDYNPKMNNNATYSQNVGKAGVGEYYQFSQERGTNAALQGSFAAGVQIMKNYVGIRGAFLDNIALDNAKPIRPAITYTGPPSYPINSLTFRSSGYGGANAFASMRWRVGEITDTNAPNYRADEPRKYEIETVWDSGPITSFNADVTIPAEALRVGSRYRVRVRFTDVTGRDSQWSPAHEFTCGEPVNQTDLLNYLRITELMFNPPPGGYEYVELYNSSSTVTLDLSGVKFTQGIDYTFAQGTMLPPGGYIVLVGTGDIAGFRAYHGLDGSVTILGPFSGALNNAGEQLVLRTSAGGTDIVNFNYGDGRGWPPQADGTGHALVLLDSALAAQGSGAGEYAGNWRASTSLRGSPGRADVLVPAGLVINEIAANTLDAGPLASNDWIELYNATDAPITLGTGWYLSDDGGAYTNLMKWQIPPGTTIPARGFVSFDEVTGFHNPTNIGFGLSRGGDEVFLSYLPGNAQDRVVDAVSFKGQEANWSLGRYPDGGPFWYALRPQTRGAANAPGGAGVVIKEIMYHPPDVLAGTNATDNPLDEFIELYYANDGAIPFFTTSGTWRLNGGIDFVFPTNVTLAGGKHLLIVNFDPETNAVQLAAFKSLYGITDSGLRILGPYSGKLANNSDRIALELPRQFDTTNGTVSWVIVDEVIYADQSPWPCGSDGTGNSLQRISAMQHGSDPLNWSAEPPTAGRARENLPPGLPVITAQPQDRIVATNATASFSVSVCGTPPFTYQWRFNGTDIANATNATLNLLNVTPASAGLYSIAVANAAGSVTSAGASLIVQFPPVIAVQPQPATAIRDQGATFSVAVGGTPPFSYQWRFNGVNISGATNSVLLLSNIQSNQAGAYSVIVNNTAGSVASSNAQLTVLIPATVTLPPTNRTVTVTFNTTTLSYSPTNVTMTVGAIGTGALRYQWRFNGVDIALATNATLVISNATPANEGVYTVVVTDNIGPTISPAATLTVMVPPAFLVPPASQTVVEGGDIHLSIGLVGNPPPFGLSWRRNLTTQILSNNTVLRTNFQRFNTTANGFVLAANTVSSNYQCRLVAYNAAFPSPGVQSLFNIIVLADSDRDGIPDVWESTYGGGSTNLDPAADLDGDGMKNAEEYIAGTDPTDNLSYLKVESIGSTVVAEQQVRIEFNAVSNRTYSVLFSEQPGGPVWSRVADVVAMATNRAVQVFDLRPAVSPPRYYRLMTPINQ